MSKMAQQKTPKLFSEEFLVKGKEKKESLILSRQDCC
jgi:hypothetical protein